MRDVFQALKSIVTKSKYYKGIENKKTINALINLITNVLKVCNDEVSIMAIKCLKFLVSTLDHSYFEEQKNQIYGVLLRSLSYRYVLIAICSDIQMTCSCAPLNYLSSYLTSKSSRG